MLRITFGSGSKEAERKSRATALGCLFKHGAVGGCSFGSAVVSWFGSSNRILFRFGSVGACSVDMFVVVVLLLGLSNSEFIL